MTGARPIVVRPTVAADWPALKQLRLAALRDAPTAFGVTHAQALGNSDAQWLARAAGSGPGTFYMAWHGQEAIGMAAAVSGDDGKVGLIAMWVAPAWRGDPRSVAARLVDAVKARAVAVGAAGLLLEVAPSNARAVAFYARQGFQFQSHVERLASHPEIEVQRMAWKVGDRRSAPVPSFTRSPATPAADDAWRF